MMNSWVRTIDETAMAIIIDERKDVNKLKKLTSFRNRSPTGTSPATKNRKSSVDPAPNYKDKDKKNWKGKVVKQLKRMGGGGHGPLYPEGGSIGVPLDECPLCPELNDNELVPYLVKVSVYYQFFVCITSFFVCITSFPFVLPLCIYC